MIPGYDDYHERLQRGESAYTCEGLINKINAMQDECEAAGAQVDPYRDELTELLKMDWPGGVCPDDRKIIEAVKSRFYKFRKSLIAERVKYNLLFPEMWNKEDRRSGIVKAIEQLKSEGILP